MEGGGGATASTGSVGDGEEKYDRGGGGGRGGGLVRGGSNDSSGSLAANEKLQKLTGESPEERLTAYLQNVLYDHTTPEGRTRLHFLNNISELVREPRSAAMLLRQFIDGLFDYVTETRQEPMVDILGLCMEEQDEEAFAHISDLVMSLVEQAVYLPVASQIESCLVVDVVEEQALVRKLARLLHEPQSFFGVQVDQLNSTGWQNAVFELSYVDKLSLPSDKLHAVLASARAVYAAYNEEKNLQLPPSARTQHFLGADEFLPVFIYVVVQARLQRPLLLKKLLWATCDPEVLRGEGGYYLTVYEAALSYVQGLNLASVRSFGAMVDKLNAVDSIF